jgi:hypothetical protein
MAVAVSAQFVVIVEVWAQVSMLGSMGTSTPARARRIISTMISSIRVRPRRLYWERPQGVCSVQSLAVSFCQGRYWSV